MTKVYTAKWEMPKGLLGIMKIIENKWYILILMRDKLTISIRF